MSMDELTKWAVLLANVATFLGIPVAVFVFLRDQRRNRRDREYTTFITLNSMYMDHLRFCFEHPEMEPAEVLPDSANEPHPDEGQKKVAYLLLMVMCQLETAYFLYQDQSSEFRRKQWSGWEELIRMWCRHPEFRARWPGIIEQFDAGFAEIVKIIYSQTTLLEHATQ